MSGVFLILLAIMVFFAPNYLGHADNYIEANPLSTPAHIVPEWYFWPFYAILRAFTVDFILPAKLWGVLAMFASILLLFFLPWLDKSPVRSGTFRPQVQDLVLGADGRHCTFWVIWAVHRRKSLMSCSARSLRSTISLTSSSSCR